VFFVPAGLITHAAHANPPVPSRRVLYSAGGTS
jgi:hypothetical protein